MKIHKMEFIPLDYGENLDIRPDLFGNRGQIARNFQFWRRYRVGSPRFMGDMLKVLVFHPWFMDLWVKWSNFVLDLGKMDLVHPWIGFVEQLFFYITFPSFTKSSCVCWFGPHLRKMCRFSHLCTRFGPYLRKTLIDLVNWGCFLPI